MATATTCCPGRWECTSGRPSIRRSKKRRGFAIAHRSGCIGGSTRDRSSPIRHIQSHSGPPSSSLSSPPPRHGDPTRSTSAAPARARVSPAVTTAPASRRARCARNAVRRRTRERWTLPVPRLWSSYPESCRITREVPTHAYVRTTLPTLAWPRQHTPPDILFVTGASSTARIRTCWDGIGASRVHVPAVRPLISKI